MVGLFISMYSACEILLGILQCSPVRKLWEPSVHGVCLNVTITGIVPGAINAATDFFVVLLPIPLIYKMHMQRKLKVQLIGIFFLGSL